MERNNTLRITLVAATIAMFFAIRELYIKGLEDTSKIGIEFILKIVTESFFTTSLIIFFLYYLSLGLEIANKTKSNTSDMLFALGFNIMGVIVSFTIAIIGYLKFFVWVSDIKIFEITAVILFYSVCLLITLAFLKRIKPILETPVNKLIHEIVNWIKK